MHRTDAVNDNEALQSTNVLGKNDIAKSNRTVQ